jgi:lysozyme
LEKIAERYDTTTDVLMTVNNLRSANRIYVGQRLKIPATGDDGEDGEGRDDQPSVYVVESGDTLEGIARRYDTTVTALVSINDLNDKDTILKGQEIRLRKRESGARPSDVRDAAFPSAPTVAAGKYITHTVARGDRLEKIAERYDTTTDVLMSVNNLRSVDRIYVGQRLRIPGMKSEGEGDSTQSAPPPVYVVKGGDTLGEIAQRHGTTVKTLVSVNGLNNGDTILRGQELSLKKPEGHTKPVGENRKVNSPSQPAPLHDTIEGVIDHDIKAQLKEIKDSNARQMNAPKMDRESKGDADPSTATDASPEKNGRSVHIVRRGEMLDLIARRYNTTTARLMELNNIKRKDRIFVNQRLKIPKGQGTGAGEGNESAAPLVYVVRRGDSLARIATCYNTTIGTLLKLNGLKLTDTLYVDQRIKVPSGGKTFTVYVVRKGDFLSKIADRHGTTTMELRRINNLESKNRIYVGQRLRVPVL